MRRENKARINGLEERTKAIQSGWGDVIKGMVNQNGAYSDEESHFDEWLMNNDRFHRYEEERDDEWDDKRYQWYYGDGY